MDIRRSYQQVTVWAVSAILCIGMLTGGAWGQPSLAYKLKLPGVISYELNLPSLVAYANGDFLKQGIEVTDFVTGSGGMLRTAMIAREFDFGLFAFVHVPLARLAGSPWKVLLSLHDLEIFSLVVRSQLKDKVKTVQDVRGLKVGFSTPGAGSWYMGQLYLKKSGLDPDKDVQYLSLGGDPGVIYTALKTGRVDAMSAWEPTTTRVIEEGVAYPLVPIWDPNEHRKWVGEKALALMLVTREEVIARNPGVVRRVVEAHRRGLEFIRTHSSREIVSLVLKNPKTAEQFEGLDQALLVKIFDRIKPGFGNGCLSRSGFDTEMKLAVDYKLVKQAITFEEFADTRLATVCP
jgi:NitT/TauT family transport system substrate-binding protein